MLMRSPLREGLEIRLISIKYLKKNIKSLPNSSVECVSIMWLRVNLKFDQILASESDHHCLLLRQGYSKTNIHSIINFQRHLAPGSLKVSSTVVNSLGAVASLPIFLPQSIPIRA